MIHHFLCIVAGVLSVVGGPGLAATMSLNVPERRRELAIMRAISARPGTLWLVVVAEGVFTALLSSLLACVLARPLFAALTRIRAVRIDR